MTDRQREILHHIEKLWTDKGPPTVRSLCTATGVTSTAGVMDHLKALQRKGVIRLRTAPTGDEPTPPRTYVVLDRILRAETWPWFTITLQGKSANYLISIQAPTWSLAGVWAREDWHAIGGPDSIKGALICFSPRKTPEFDGWKELSHGAE